MHQTSGVPTKQNRGHDVVDTLIANKKKCLKRLVDKVAEHPSAPKPKLFEAFLSAYFTPFPAELLNERDEDSLFAMALNHWQSFLQHRSGTPTIRVYVPRADRDGWETTHLVVQVVVDDRPFLVDSLSTALNERSLTVHLAAYPGFDVTRDKDSGEIKQLGKGDERVIALHFEVDRRSGRDAIDELREDLMQIFDSVRLASTDWQAMRGRMHEVRNELESLDAEDPEVIAFLDWLEGDHFTFLGYREYKLARKNKEDQLIAVEGSDLGTAKLADKHSVSETFAMLPKELRAQFRDKTPLIITKSHVKSRVHRAVHMDYIGIKSFDKQGNVAGEHRFLGLFTASFYHLAPAEVPLVRTKIEGVMERTAVPRDSHDGKALLNIMQTYPRDELLQIDVADLHANAVKILGLRQRQRSCIFIRREPFGRFVSCLVYIPRDRFSTEVRRRIQDTLMKRFDGVSSDLRVSLSESVFAQVYLMIHTPKGQAADYDLAELEAEITELTRSWPDEFENALIDHFGEEKGSGYAELYAHAFPAGYRELFEPRAAAWDVESVEAVRSSGTLQLSLYHFLEDPEGTLRFKLYAPGGPVMLSDVLPVLENMGVRVAGETPFAIRPSDGSCVQMHDFSLKHAEGDSLNSDQVREAFQDAFAHIWRGDAENDGFNRLVLRAGLNWRQVAMLRAYARYLRQTKMPFSQNYMEDTLAANPDIARQIVRLFEARFDPKQHAASTSLVESISQDIQTALDQVASLDADRILRGLTTLVQTTLRTNYFQAGQGDGATKSYISFKLDPALIPDLPDPRPAFEIWVYSPRVEGVHLRGGKVARGGLRWSDRMEDFRTEILGLAKAQMVKNSIIVPVGAKGGFICKQLPTDAQERRTEVENCYKTFIRGLLDLSDNLANGDVVPPKQVVRYDEDDPYLVVAADKGTATFSDTANAVAAEYGFWLGDAFASGGSVGYDHKAMGITAKGAWEAVKRHFREMGVDTQNDDFTVSGVGDMSGDVFGNGMLLSEHIRLIAAFDHRDIFIDPDPDAASSYAERKRLFELPRSSWQDYDKSLISKGGGIYPRSAKSIKLSKAAQKALGLEQESLTPNELMRAILKAPVDLFWNGGIGTYVRATSETDLDVGDRSNDAVRITAPELGSKVVGEGGNLGLTQLARIEFARHGGRINTDAIDNAGGVNCSDHEVNIKILLDRIVQEGDMTGKQRDKLLREMTDTVGELVIKDNYWQTSALSFMERRAPELLDEHRQFIETMAAEGHLNPAIEFLPDEKGFEKRKTAGEGLTRPELAVVLAYARMHIYDALLESDAPEDPFLEHELMRYFPKVLRQPYRDAMLQHRLKREIIATFVTTRIVNRLGATLMFRMAQEHGYSIADITRAYLAVWEIFSLRELWLEAAELDNKVDAETQLSMVSEAVHLAHRATLWLLRNRPTPLPIEETAREFGPCGEALISNLEGTLTDIQIERIQDRMQPLLDAKVPEHLARRIAQINALYATFDVHSVSVNTGLDEQRVASIFFGLDEALDLHWLRQVSHNLPSQDRWEERARSAMADDLYNIHHDLTLAVAQEDGDRKLESWTERREGAINRYHQMIAKLREAEDKMNGARLAVMLRALRELVPGG
ncbi:MAG: NAD-glutamate dehydrogenase [Gammaproteobacteria bacterium]